MCEIKLEYMFEIRLLIDVALTVDFPFEVSYPVCSCAESSVHSCLESFLESFLEFQILGGINIHYRKIFTLRTVILVTAVCFCLIIITVMDLIRSVYTYTSSWGSARLASRPTLCLVARKSSPSYNQIKLGPENEASSRPCYLGPSELSLMSQPIFFVGGGGGGVEKKPYGNKKKKKNRLARETNRSLMQGTVIALD